jgi:hypothetical protein
MVLFALLRLTIAWARIREMMISEMQAKKVLETFFIE